MDFQLRKVKKNLTNFADVSLCEEFFYPPNDNLKLPFTVRYLYQSRVHQVVVGDSEGLRLPKNAHRVASSGTTTPPMNSTS